MSTKQYGEVPYYYIYGNCKYECKYKGDWFDLTNGEVEMSKSEEELDAMATKHYYSTEIVLKNSWTREEVEEFIKNSYSYGYMDRDKDIGFGSNLKYSLEQLNL